MQQAAGTDVPQHETSYAEFLYFTRLVRQFKRSPLATSDCVSLIIDDAGQLLTFGTTEPMSDDDASGWFENAHGRRKQRHPCHLGHGSKFKTLPVPKPIKLRLRIWSCAAGEEHCLALTEAGHVLSWGSNAKGQCGRQRDGNRQWTEFGLIRATASPGLVRVIGEDDEEPVRFGTIAAVGMYSAALSLDGHLYEWGKHCVLSPSNFDNHYYWMDIGDGFYTKPTRKDWSSPFVLAHGGDESSDALVGVRLSTLAAGEQHLIVLTSEGTAMSWGDGSTGALGHEVLWQNGQLLGYDPDASKEMVPRVIQTLKHVQLAAIAVGKDCSLAVDAEGGVWGWGGDGWSGTHGSGAGDPPCLPTRVLSLAAHKITNVFVFDVIAMATRDDGQLLSWGSADYPGLLGHSSQALRGCAMQSVGPGGTREFQLPNGAVVELADSVIVDHEGHSVPQDPNDEPDRVLYEPTQLAELTNKRVVHVSASWCHALALTDDGAVFSWGEGASSALGLDRLEHVRDVLRSVGTEDEHAVMNGVSWPDGTYVEVPTRIHGVRGAAHWTARRV